MHYIVDTHPLFWAMFAEHRLHPQVQRIFEQTASGIHTIYVPAIVVTELMIIIERRCTTAKYVEFLELFRTMQTAGNYLFLPLMPETVIATYALTDIPDVFDRLVVAEARRLRKPLITYDQTIRSSGLVDTLWD